MKKFLLAGIASLALVSAADADVQIKMKPGAQCWSYQGYDTRFYGDFAGGQALTLAFVFQEKNDHGGIKASAYNGDRVWVNGPGGFYLDGNREPAPDDPFINTEKSGRYIFNLYEHGNGTTLPVFFQICAMRKD
jgi:hypothetical protein